MFCPTDKTQSLNYLYCAHQTLDFLLVQDRRNRSDDDVHRDVMDLFNAVRVNRPVVAA